MILDQLDNAARYFPLNDRLAQAFEFLMRADLKTLPVGRHEIEGDCVFAIIAKEAGREREAAQLETHQNYIDIQFVLAGVETMGWKPHSLCRQPTAAYDPSSDLQFFADEPDAWLATHPGTFAIFFPEDAHMPLIASTVIHKVIVKVLHAP